LNLYNVSVFLVFTALCSRNVCTEVLIEFMNISRSFGATGKVSLHTSV